MPLVLQPPSTDRPLRFELPEIERVEQLSTLADAGEVIWSDLARASLPITQKRVIQDTSPSKGTAALDVLERKLYEWQQTAKRIPAEPVRPSAGSSGSARRKHRAEHSRWTQQIDAQLRQVNLDVAQVNDYLAALEVTLRKQGLDRPATPMTTVKPKRALRWY